jgi:PAS domain S-box-containing protein
MDRADLEQWRPKDVARLLALVESQRRYFQEIVAAIPVGVLVLSPDLDVILANGAVRKIFNLTASGPVGLKLETVLPKWVLDRIGQALKTGVSENNILVDTQLAGKRRLQIGILAIHSWDDEAAPEALLTIEDLSGARAAAQAEVLPAGRAGAVLVREGGITAPDVLNHLDAAVWAVELRSMNFVFVNGQAQGLLGFPADFWINNPSFWADRVYPGDRELVTQCYRHAIERQEGATCEFRALTANGRLVWLRETVRVVADSEGRPALLAGISVDVTERRLLEQQQIQSERVDAIRRFASRMAHDLNNLLMVPMGNAEELLNALPATSPLHAEAQEILTATERMKELTNHLLAFARRPPALADTIELEPVLAALSERVGVIEILGSGSPNRVKANAGELEQVLTAVVEFVRKASPVRARITVETSRVEIREELQRGNAPLRQGDFAVISVISPHAKRETGLDAATFERFLPEKDATDETAAPLARAYALVRRWGGDISVSNGPAEGLLFRIFLERVGGAPEVPVEPSSAEAGTSPASAALATILVVEDEAGIRALVRKFLRKHGYEIFEAANGEQALAMLAEHHGRIDVLITDMVMAQMGGRELVDRLREQGRDMKVLYISGYTDDASVYAAELPPGSAFLQKPFTLSALLEKVQQILGRV